MPWRSDELDAVLVALTELADALTPSPLPRELVGDAGTMWEPEEDGWASIVGAVPPDLDPWSRRHLDGLVALEAEAAAAKAKAALDAAKAEEAARKAALPKLKVDGKWGAATTAAIQKVLGTKVGGDWINNTDAKALQKKLGVKADGLFGTESNKALQKYLKVTADGVFGPNSVKALQKALNAGTFFPAETKKAAPAAKKGL